MKLRECIAWGLLAAVLVLKWQPAPGPGPGPLPPGPAPTPAPITDAGLRVLVTYDADHKADLPREQLALVDSNSLRAWLDEHCAKRDGVPEWRIVPADEQFDADEPTWQQLMAGPRQAPAWLVATDGKTGVSVPLPANEAAALAILGRFSP